MPLRRPAPRPALVLFAFLAAGFLALTGCTAVPEDVDEAARGFGVGLNPDRADVVSLQAGDCFLEPDGEETIGVTTVDCAEQHDSELFHVLILPESVEEYPADQEHLWQEHEEACFGQAFEDYVGETWDVSAWNVYTFRPTDEAWSLGDRRVECILYSLDGRYWTGSPSTGDADVIPHEESEGPTEVSS